MKYEVRCCCVPEKLVGWLDWPDDAQTEMTFQLLEPAPLHPTGPRSKPTRFKTIVLTLDYYTEAGRRYEAVKAEGVAIEQLRRVRGFVENK